MGRPTPHRPGALRKATLDDVEMQLRQARQRAHAICAQLKDLDLELRLLDRVSDCAELGDRATFGDRATLAEIVQSQRESIALSQAFD